MGLNNGVHNVALCSHIVLSSFTASEKQVAAVSLADQNSYIGTLLNAVCITRTYIAVTCQCMHKYNG